MTNRRIERLNEQLKRELTDVLLSDVRDPRVGRVTITEVRATPDLYHARVFVTSLGDEDERAQALEGLRAASAYIRGELGRRLHVRRIPELAFEWDETLEHARRIENLLREVRPAAPEAGAPTDPGADGAV
jgi:ribosome-binding factor A